VIGYVTNTRGDFLMKSNFPLIIGGALPAFLWGITAVFQKLSAGAMLGPGRYLTLFGLMIALSGVFYSYISNETGFNFRGAIFAIVAGLTFALGTGLLSFALWRYGIPISRVSPILSANVLVPVAVGLVFLGENAGVNVAQLMVGTLFIVGGVIVVTNA
jgi:uncharacterized membrane protein